MQIIQQSSIDKSVPIQVVISDLVSVIESLKDVSNTNACPVVVIRATYSRNNEIIHAGTVTLTPKTLWIITKACYPMLLAGIAKGGFQSTELRTALDGLAQLQKASKQGLSQDKWPMFDVDGLTQLQTLLKGLVPAAPQAQQQTVTLKK